MFLFLYLGIESKMREREKVSHMNDYLNLNKQWIIPKSNEEACLTKILRPEKIFVSFF